MHLLTSVIGYAPLTKGLNNRKHIYLVIQGIAIFCCGFIIA